MLRTAKLLVVLALVLTALIVATAGGQTPPATEAYLSPTGDDTAACTSAAPCKSFTRAATILPAGGDIRLAPGKYGWQSNYQAKPTGTLTVHAAGATVNGLTCKGCRNLTILGAHWTGTIDIDSRTGLSDPPQDVKIRDAEITPLAGQSAIRILNAARNIEITGSRIVGGTIGIQGPTRTGPEYTSSEITIQGNHLSGQTTDGIAFGDWNDVTILGNEIEDIKDPCLTGPPCIHNDGIQFYGGSEHVAIVGNRIVRARSQGIFVQAANRPIDDLTVAQNLVEDTYSVPIVFENITHARVIGNTVCGGQESDGGLWLGGPADDYVSKDNMVGSLGQPQLSYSKPNGGATLVDDGNVVVAC